MQQMFTILFAIAALLILHWSLQQGSRKVGQKLGKLIGLVLRAPLRAVLTPYYRRKVIRQMQKERQNQGVPPLENTDMR
jgi:hypothetical protein